MVVNNTRQWRKHHIVIFWGFATSLCIHAILEFETRCPTNFIWVSLEWSSTINPEIPGRENIGISRRFQFPKFELFIDLIAPATEQNYSKMRLFHLSQNWDQEIYFH